MSARAANRPRRPRCRLLLAALLLHGAALGVAATPAYRYDEAAAATAGYFAALSNLAHAVMFSGLGEPLITSPYERDDWLRRAGYVVRPRMPELALVGALYAAAQPRFDARPDFDRPATLAWDPGSFERTLDPGAQAWALLKITAPEFHLQYHRLPENRLAALMMVPQARQLAATLERRLLDADGRFAARTPAGEWRAPTPRDQVAVLWAVSSLILAGTSDRADYWHAAYRDLTDPAAYRRLARTALDAVTRLPPATPAERGLAIAALGRFALATDRPRLRQQALDLARELAAALQRGPAATIEDAALAIYGLVEAGRLFGEAGYGASAAEFYRGRLQPAWNEAAGVFVDGAGAQTYTPRSVGAVIAALDALRWYGPDDLAAVASRRYPRFFQAAVIESGLLRASPLPLVSAPYREAAPDAHFAHPRLPDAVATGVAPVFASAVVLENGTWSVTDPAFRTADALFLANLLVVRHAGRADSFLPDDRLAVLHRATGR